MKKVLKNIIIGILALLALFFCMKAALFVMTRHNMDRPVPNLVGLQIPQARQLALESRMEIVTVDSVHVAKVKKGAVYHQNPKAGTKVKTGRKIYLTVNAVLDRKVVMPDLVGLSLRQAKTELVSRGFVPGSLTYARDIATNNVLDQFCKGQSLPGDTLLPAGSVIDLLLGKGEDAFVQTPNLIGMPLTTARDLAFDNTFNVRTVLFDGTVRTRADSLSAFVFSQIPEAGERVEMGSPMTMELTLDIEKILSLQPEEEEEEQQPADTILLQ